MALIQNLVARLTLDSKAFDRNAKRSGQSMKSMQRQSLALQKGIVRLAGAYLGIRGLTGALKSVVRAAIEQEKSERALSAALGQTGKTLSANMAELKRYAAEIQKVTVYGDELILSQMAYGRNLGITASKLEEATVAAAGLAGKYQIDLQSAMMLVGRASQGQTQMLTRYGIILDETLDDQEKFNALLRIGADAFALARAEAETTAGQMRQLNNTWGDSKEILGESLLPAINKVAKATKSWLQDNQRDIKKWADDFVEGIDIVKTAMASLSTADKPFREGFDRLGKRDRQALSKAYSDRTGQRMGYQQVGASGYTAMAGATREAFIQPDDMDYARKLLQSYQRARSRGKNDDLKRRVEGLGGSPAMGNVIASGETGSGGSDIVDETAKKLLAETEKLNSDIMAARRRMVSDMDRATAESLAVRTKLLKDEYDDYAKFIEDKTLLDTWYHEQQRKLAIDRAKATGGLTEGFKAGIAEMQAELQTLGELGADLAVNLRDGIVASLSDAVFEAQNLGEALKATARSMAAMAFQWGSRQILQAGLNAFIGGAVGAVGSGGGGAAGAQTVPAGDINPSMAFIAHGGTNAAGGSRRLVDPGLFAHAPRLHDGLASDEFRTILQRGEEVTSKSQVAASGRLDREIVGLLRQIAAKDSPNVLVVRSREEIFEALQSRAGQRTLMEIVGRNQ